MKCIFGFIFSLLVIDCGIAETRSYAIFYLDKTASMNIEMEGKTTRCQASKKIAQVSIRNFFEKWSGRAIDVRTFSEPGNIVSLTNGFTESKSTAIAAVDDAPCDGPSTALADAICDGVDSLRMDFSTVTGDETYLMLVTATDGEENSSTGECGGADWKAKVESRIKGRSPSVRLNMNVFGELGKIATGTAGGSSMQSESLRFFSKLSVESGGAAIFVNDYAETLPEFFPIFPNDERFLVEMKAKSHPVQAWESVAAGDEIGYAGLKVDAASFHKTKQGIGTSSITQPVQDFSQDLPKLKVDHFKVYDSIDRPILLKEIVSERENRIQPKVSTDTFLRSDQQ